MFSKIYGWILSVIFSIVTGVLGVAGFIFPSAVKEHFFSLRKHILSFIVLVLIVNAVVKFFLSAVRAVIELFGMKDKMLNRIISFMFVSLYSEGFSQGYDDGYYGYTSKLYYLDEKSIFARLLSVIKYFVAFMLLYSIVMNTNW